MSQTETLADLNSGNVLIGFEEKRGKAWWWRKGLQNGEPNHYTGAIPVEDVISRLFYWDALEGSSEVTCVTENGVLVVQDKKRKAIVRSDTGEIFGYFSGQPEDDKGYKIHQYQEWLVEYVASILGEGLQIGSAGLLKLGAVAWVSIELPENFTTPEGVDFRPIVTATTSHDGSVATSYFDSILLPVCDNTLALAKNEKGNWKVTAKHTRNSEKKIVSSVEASGLIGAAAEQFKEQVKQLCAIDVSDGQFVQWLDKVIPVPSDKGRGQTIAQNKRGTLIALWEADARVKPWKNTAFGVLQASNTFGQHESSVRGDKVERNMLKVIDGSFDKADAKALDALQLVLA